MCEVCFVGGFFLGGEWCVFEGRICLCFSFNHFIGILFIRSDCFWLKLCLPNGVFSVGPKILANQLVPIGSASPPELCINCIDFSL